jgi:hypothetical protein
MKTLMLTSAVLLFATAGGAQQATTRSVARDTARKIYPKATNLRSAEHPAASISLTFQLIAAEDAPTRDPGLAGLDSLLRGVLRFNGYRLLGTAVVSAGEFADVTQTLTATDQEAIKLSVSVRDVYLAGEASSVRLTVRMVRNYGLPNSTMRGMYDDLLTTGVTVPIGQTVVLGTAAVTGNVKALILTVKPQLAAVRSK